MAQRETLAGEVEEILGAHPRARVLTSLPGIGVTTAARILLKVGGSATTWPAGTTSAMENRMVLKENGPTRRGHGPQFAAVQPVTVVVCDDQCARQV
jgi:Holliday junction resolvasome RuvABC DNA-binding subunit